MRNKALNYLKHLSEKYLKAHKLIQQKIWKMMGVDYVESPEFKANLPPGSRRPTVHFNADLASVDPDPIYNEEYKQKLDKIVSKLESKIKELDFK